MASIPASATELFDRILPGLLKTYPEKAKEIGGIYAFRLTGEGGGEWSVDLNVDEPQIQKGILSTAQCTVTIDHQDFVGLMKNPATAMPLFLQGKIKVEGNPMLALKFQKLFSIGSS